MSFGALLRAMRPHQWSKNVFVLAALVFAAGDPVYRAQLESGHVVRVLLAFLAFGLSSSAIYLVNDVADVESDRKHPEKCKRPIAAGELSIPAALIAAVGLVVPSLLIGAWVGGSPRPVWAVLLIYVVINAAYNLRLKQVVLVDVFCIAAGFLLRVVAGGLAAGAEISKWLILCTLFLSLFIALNKRRAEMMVLGDDMAAHRKSLKEYSVGFLDQMVGVLAACTVVCYTMYTVDEDTASKFGRDNLLFWTVPFVTFGIGRYMILVQNGQGGGNPARILLGGDAAFLVNTLLWGGTVLFALFGG